MYMLVIYCCFSSVQTERKNHDFSSHVVVIRPSFYIINDAFSIFMAITIFCRRVQRRSVFHSISQKEITIFSLWLIIEIIYYRFLDRNLYVVLVIVFIYYFQIGIYTWYQQQYYILVLDRNLYVLELGYPTPGLFYNFIWFFSNGFCCCSPLMRGGRWQFQPSPPLKAAGGRYCPSDPSSRSHVVLWVR